MNKREELLKDHDIERWYRDVSRGSLITAEINLRRLSLFCEQNSLTSEQLVDSGKKTGRNSKTW